VLLPWVIPTALSTLGWWWMFNSLYSVVNWTGHRAGRHGSAGAELARAAVLRHGRGHHRQHLARAALLRHHDPGRAGGHPQELYEAAESDGAGANAASGT
jgi:ABC-type sugar transport system permease subunit